ncbi:MAG TPA: DNRLRE domain-containing protein, partial [Candidatus Krumholzibacteria bacterium]|nr:DNRLRE domain-containing protein [Candidatus Krumholzibacteria bacterium]
MSIHRYARATWLIAFVMVAVESDLASGGTVVITSSRDNTLFEDPLGALSSGAGPSIFAGNNSTQNIRRALVYFDVAAAVPAGVVIDSVELQLYVSSAPNDVPQVVTIHPVLADWGEGSSVSVGGSGAPATVNDATWLHRFYPASFWTSAGGDFDPVSHGSTSVGGIGSYAWNDELLTSDVRAWYEALANNFGWLVAGNESGASTVRRFESHETADPDQRPRL